MTTPTSAPIVEQQAERGNRARFAAWARSYGVKPLARDLGLKPEHRHMIYKWVRGDKGRLVAPSISYMTRIIALSEQSPFEYGPLTYDDMLAGTSGLRGLQRHVSPKATLSPSVTAA